MTKGSEDGCSQQYGKSYFLLIKPITINNQLDKNSPGNILISYHECHFSAPKPRNGTSFHAQTQVFSNSWPVRLATPRLITVRLPKVHHAHIPVSTYSPPPARAVKNFFKNGDYKDRFPLLIALFRPITNSLLYFPPLPFMLFLACFLSFPFPHSSFFLVPSGLYFLHIFFLNLCRGIQQ